MIDQPRRTEGAENGTSRARQSFERGALGCSPTPRSERGKGFGATRGTEAN